ncbi:Uncharacterised protein [Mycobacterium tuberculosis]|nr:Uncharacterised protein [Mycobacterium tuberculosis]CKV81915.1 Uncharacterised protein [Mycobacterium tuberculosis]
MTDGADHGRTAGRDRAAQRLVRKRQQVLDGAAAPGQHDHVDVRVSIELAQRLDDLADGVGALHGDVADGETCRWPARRGHRRNVTFGGTRTAGDQTDHVGQVRDRPLEAGVEEPLGVQQPAQPVDACQQLADADSANLAEPQGECATSGVERGLAADHYLNAFGQLHRRGQHQVAGTRHGQRHVGRRIAQYHEHRLGVWAHCDLGQLPLHPDRAQLVDPARDPDCHRANRERILR